MPVDPSIAAVLDQVNAHPAPRIIDTDPEVLREVNRQMGAGLALPEPIEVGSVQDTTVPGPAGRIPVRVYRPDRGGPVPTVVFFHGGGWLTGDLDSHDDVTRRMCRDVHAVVVAVDYRLAPGHPFPAAYDDCLAAAHRIADHIDDYGGRRDRLAVAGDSAGGNLAAAVALTFRDEGRPLAAQLLVYPATDFIGDYPSRTENATGYVLSQQDVLDIQHLYAGDDPAVRGSWQVSPLRAENFTGLAPAVIGTAQYDPLRDEGNAYAEALTDAGVDVFARSYDGLIHAFLNLFPVSPAADAAVTELYAQLKERLS
ncbi:alpha/beta hydrolase [Streptomyces sp. NBC_00249]|uniref:alpha/beta hydrolase n=1 Tax=Streptomyces sp. NBC_00249 TaxID=2975690 RepID=UPI00224E43EB|nr:alpha/beta hydrolase [Streptomyces sp. NBC_00249]MCX5193590.1 alpha/beta hydrolase [Streptomyces sp. NBC_00249]